MSSWRKKRRALGYCSGCGKYKCVKGRTRCHRCIRYHQERAANLTRAERDKINKKRNEQNRAAKEAAFLAYGGYICVCCGETSREFLTLDHVKNDGAAHRKMVGGGAVLYCWLRKRKFPPGFQILCMNCNFSLGINGYCPHHPEIKRSTKQGRPRWLSR